MKFDRTSLVCYLTAIVLGIFYGCYRTSSGPPFDSTKWKSLTDTADDNRKREAMVPDLLANHSPVGLTCEEAEALLGNNYYTMEWEGEDVWFFELGYETIYHPGIPSTRKLKLTVENGRITKAVVHYP